MSHEIDIARARELLERAGTLRDALQHRELDGAKALLERADQLIRSHIGQLSAQAANVVAEYNGMPVRVNPFEVMDVMDSELAHSATLRWLLDPAGSHGLGDSMLRRLLARCGSRHAIALADAEQPLQAVVANEITLNEGRIDLLIALRAAVVGIEVKVWAQESRLSWGRHKRKPQTTIYRLQLEDPQVRRRALASMGAEAAALPGSRPQVMMFFIRPAGAESAGDGERTTTLSWLHIERDLALAMRRRQPAAEAEPLLRAFRSTVLERSGSKSPQMARIAALRRLVDMPNLRRIDPLRTLLQLRALEGHDEEINDGQ